jgi:glycosyltransferase involved in cell wall biosynthesis
VCGEAAILFDPRDVDALAAQLERVVDDSELRRDLARRGEANCARFSWERTAGLVADVYHAA